MDEYIILVVNTQLSITYSTKINHNIDINGLVYEDILQNDYVGFYDWLRSSKNEVCGIRFIPFDFAEPIIKGMAIFPYIHILSDSAIEIYFKPAMTYNENISNDQDFGVAKIYMSKNKNFLFCFDISKLTSEERQSLNVL